MRFDKLTNDNFLLYAAHHYDNLQCHDVSEFYEDLKRIKYIKKLFTRYVKNSELKERLILNHIIILNNVFGPIQTSKLLLFKTDESLWPLLKPFLILLNILPEKISGFGEENKIVHTDEILLDKNIVNILRNI
jgi:hypothetical protein